VAPVKGSGMAVPVDPSLRHVRPARTCAIQSPDLCPRCLGAGRYLEALDCEPAHVYLPVVCEGCGGSGRVGGAREAAHP
jgi:DnaJ-class molecular chaperone